MTLTIDSSVFVAAFVETEPKSESAYSFLQQVVSENHEVVIPVTVLVEAVLAVSRRGNQELAEELKKFILDLENVKIIELDLESSLGTIDFAKPGKLRGMDAIVVFVASEFGSSLVSLDQEMVDRTRGQVEIYSL